MPNVTFQAFLQEAKRRGKMSLADFAALYASYKTA